MIELAMTRAYIRLGRFLDVDFRRKAVTCFMLDRVALSPWCLGLYHPAFLLHDCDSQKELCTVNSVGRSDD